MTLKNKTVGILGGGQLARMLCLRAREMGIQTYLLSQQSTDPAAKIAHHWFKGDPNKTEDLKKFLKKCVLEKIDAVTFESEFVPSQLLEKCMPPKLNCYPQIDNLGQLQDRWPQKELLWDFRIPTSPFMKINGKDDLDSCYKIYNGNFVLKQRFGGYDGYGTHIIKSLADLNHFKLQFKGYENHYIAEKFINFKSEKSLLFARNLKGNIYHYPLFTTLQKSNQCDQVFGPSHHPQEKKMIKKIQDLLQHINYVGLIAFELFDTGTELFVNEIAPRVHNSGHITMDAFQIDQFEMHLRAILNLDFPEQNNSAKIFLMQNLSGTSFKAPHLLKQPDGRLYWYEKTENRPRRKMGHINYIGTTLKQLKELAAKDKKQIVL